MNTDEMSASHDMAHLCVQGKRTAVLPERLSAPGVLQKEGTQKMSILSLQGRTL
jgi:hypothetical protein